MTSSAFQIRRATIDDLGALQAMWAAMRIPNHDLEKRLTEFQVAVDESGTLVGAVGLLILGRQGLIHSEAFTDFGVADAVRPLFWTRLNALALNHGVARYWTRENSPFWAQVGLHPAGEAELNRLPEIWDRSLPGWWTLQLKDEDAIASLDKEFEMFVASEKRRSADALGTAQKARNVAMIIVTLLILALLAGAFWVFFRYRSNLPSAQ